MACMEVQAAEAEDSVPCAVATVADTYPDWAEARMGCLRAQEDRTPAEELKGAVVSRYEAAVESGFVAVDLPACLPAELDV